MHIYRPAVRPEDIVCRAKNCCDSKTNVRNGCANVIASIALAEASVAHILNAEGEKIQKTLELASEPGEVIAVNRSVSETVRHIARLEQILCEKLALAKETLEQSHCAD